MFAAQITVFGFFGVPMYAGLTPITFFIVIYCVYNVLFTYYMNGQTPGKALGRLVVVDEYSYGGQHASVQISNAELHPPAIDGELRQKPELTALFLRESCKAMYSFPVVGWVAGLMAIIMLMAGRVPLHDRVGKTVVVFVGKVKK